VDDAPILLVDRDAEFRHRVERTAEGFGLRVVVAAEARRGLEIARAAQPACAIVELELGPAAADRGSRSGEEKDGLWLAAELRLLPDLAGAPIVLLTSNDDVLVRLRALQGGIDLLLDKPIEAAVLVAQVRALVTMAARIRDRGAISSMLRRAALDDSPSMAGPSASFVGEIAAMPPATALTILEIDQRTGALEMRGAGRPALTLELASGFVLGGDLGGKPLESVEAIREALGMKRGRFEFRARPSRPAPPGLMPTTRQLWMAIDEAARSTQQRGLPSAPATEVTEPPVDVLDGRGSASTVDEQRAFESPHPPKSIPKPPQRTTTLASSPAVDARLVADRRGAEEKKKPT
jgi:CheY-like chemotaxis protein